MSKLSASDVLPFLVLIAILLGVARIFGEIFRRLNMPAVIGELFAGVLMGPTLIGHFFPGFFQTVFIDPKQPAVAFDGIARIGIIFFLFIAGMEVNLDNIRRRGKAAAKISFSGILFPLAVGFAATWFFYDNLFSTPTTNKLAPALFMGTALSITALSVMAKILIDTDLLKSRFGNLMMTAAMIDDFIGWLLFSVVITVANLKSDGSLPAWEVLVMLVAFTGLLMTVGRWLVDRGFELVNKYSSKPGGELTFAIIMCFAAGIFTEWLGIKAIFGAFLMGVAVGGSKNFSTLSKEKLHDIMTYIFAPLFFVSIGLKVDFIKSFDFQIVAFILVISIIGKLVGGFVGARLSGFKVNKALAVGFGMNARGSQEIVLGLVALQAKIIDEKIFVGLVTMTFITIIMAGPGIRYFLRRHENAIALLPHLEPSELTSEPAV